jgi:hypothetical protein
MQDDKPAAAHFFKYLPKEAITSDPSSTYFIHKWRLESLLTAYFGSSPAKATTNGRVRILQANHWEAVVTLVNLLHRIEDAESVAVLNDRDIMLEVYRIALRQFPWQRGFATKQMLYRAMRLYRTPETMKRFQNDTGIAFDDFIKLGYLYFAALKIASYAPEDFSFEVFGIDSATRDRFLDHISDTPLSFAQHAKPFHDPKYRIAHRPSRLRTHPVVRLVKDDREVFVAPLVDLVFLRVTQGLFFDFRQRENDNLKEVIADRFVAYCAEIFEKQNCAFRVLQEQEYKKGKNRFKSPDLFLTCDGLVSAAIECKARRMSYQAQFGDEPLEEPKSGFAEIAKGMVQLWRYLADANDGFLPENIKPNSETRLILLTYDSWMEASFGIEEKITAMANELADQKSIPICFRRPIIFMTVLDLEHIVARGDQHMILSVLDGQLTEKYKGWPVSGIFDKLHGELQGRDLFSQEDMLKVAPWFSSGEA